MLLLLLTLLSFIKVETATLLFPIKHSTTKKAIECSQRSFAAAMTKKCWTLRFSAPILGTVCS